MSVCGCTLQNTWIECFWPTSSVKTFVSQNIVWNVKCEEHIEEEWKYPDIRAKRLYFNLKTRITALLLYVSAHISSCNFQFFLWWTTLKIKLN